VRRRRRLLACGAAVLAIGLGLWWCRERATGLPAPVRRLPGAAAGVGSARPAARAPVAVVSAAAAIQPLALPAAAGWPGSAPAPAPYTLAAEVTAATLQTVTLTVSDYALQPAGGGGWAVTLGDAWPLAVRGEAPLPVVRYDVLLGAGAEPELEIVSATWEETACPPLLPSPGFVSRAAPPSAAATVGGVGRGAGGRFPETPARLTAVYGWRGWRGVGVILCPFRYDAAAGVLGVCRRLEVRVRGAAAAAELAGSPRSRLAIAAQRWPEPAAQALKGVESGVVQESLLVLVPESLRPAPALAEFALWKQQRGVAVSIQALAVRPTVASVKALIRAFAEGKDRANVILLGDEGAIPPAQTAVPPSDTVYTLLDGAADRYHDLSISRLTATSAGDLAAQLSRAVMYERWQWPAPGDGCAAATAVASNENQGNLGLLDREAMEVARLDLAGYGVSPCDALYDRPGVAPTKELLADAWNGGRGLVLYLGHGLQQSWRTTGFAVGDVNRLLHAGAALPFVLSAACHTGNFTLATDCLCEALLKGGSAGAPAGAVAAVGATSTMDWDPPVVMLQSFTAYLTRRAQFASGGLTFAGGLPRATASELTFGAVQRAVDFCLATPVEGDAAARRIVEQTHLFGDPTLGVRTRVPTALRVAHGQAAARGAPFELTVQDAGTGRALAGLTACIYAPGGVQWLCTTDAQGFARFSVPADLVSDVLTVTVYAVDVIPYQAAVEVRAEPPPVEVLTVALPGGRYGVPYAANLVARGGNGNSLLWSTASPLPDGLSLAPDGTLAGTPTDCGVWRVVVCAADDSVPPLSAAAEFDVLIEGMTSAAGGGDTDIDSPELLAYAAVVASGCATAAAWTEARERWGQGSQAAPAVPAGMWRGATPRRSFGAARYLPGGDETVRIDLGLTDSVPAGACAILTEVLPAGWQVTTGSGRDAAGRVLPGPRRDGLAVSWVLDEAALRGGVVSIGVRCAGPVLSPAAFGGWLAFSGGVAPTAGAYLWWPRRATRFVLVLRPGWNLISLPLDLPDGGVPTALAALDRRHCDDRGQRRGAVQTLASLRPYWVYAPAPTRLELSGFEAPEATSVLAPGWNACGVSRCLPVATLPGAPRLAWAWSTSGWEAVHSDLRPGAGYLVFRPE
jgi:hypothetical protein